MTKHQVRTEAVRQPSGHFSQAIEVDAKGKLVATSASAWAQPRAPERAPW